jgi:hypothetical protein
MIATSFLPNATINCTLNEYFYTHISILQTVLLNPIGLTYNCFSVHYFEPSGKPSKLGNFSSACKMLAVYTKFFRGISFNLGNSR